MTIIIIIIRFICRHTVITSAALAADQCSVKARSVCCMQFNISDECGDAAACSSTQPRDDLRARLCTSRRLAPQSAEYVLLFHLVALLLLLSVSQLTCFLYTALGRVTDSFWLPWGRVAVPLISPPMPVPQWSVTKLEDPQVSWG